MRHHAMGCFFEVTIRDVADDDARALLDEAVREIDAVDRVLSSWNDGSDLSRLNREGPAGPVRVDPLLLDTVERALALADETGGAFDPTVKPLVDAYGFRGSTPRVPSDAELANMRERVGARHVRVDRERGTIAFDRLGVALDLDGINKGVAVERVADLLRQAGVADATVSAGGSTIASIGPRADAPPRVVFVEDPQGRRAAEVSLRDQALSTSGNWRQVVNAGGRTFGHVFDPRTGRPVENDVLSATVVVQRAADSDALAKLCVVDGAAGAERLVAARPDAEVVLLVAKPDAASATPDVRRVDAHPGSLPLRSGAGGAGAPPTRP